MKMEKSKNLSSLPSTCSGQATRLSSKLFWPALIIAFVVALSLILWSGGGKGVSYREMACTFEERAPGCLDSLRSWNEGTLIAVSRQLMIL